MTQSPTPHNKELSRYYRDLRVLMDTITGRNGFANLGWLVPKESGKSYQDAQHELVKLVTDKLKVSSGAQILEVGCGMGGPARYTAARLGVAVTGLEILQEQIDAGKQVASEGDAVKFVQGSAEAMPFAENSFDAVYCIESAFHYADKAAFVREAARVAKPGTRIVVADIVLSEEHRGGWIEKQLKRAVAAPNFFDVDEYWQAAQSAGLEVEETHDLTPGVAKSLALIASLVVKNWKTLRRAGYGAFYLLLIIKVGWLSRYFQTLAPSRYMLFVFRKPE